MELFAYFNNKLVEALVKCTKTALDLLKMKAESLKYFDARVFLYTRLCISFLFRGLWVRREYED